MNYPNPTKSISAISVSCKYIGSIMSIGHTRWVVTVFSAFCLLCAPATVLAQTQLGADIDGESAEDGSGMVSLSSDGNRLAIGAPENDGNGSNSGHARVYQWSGMAWTQLGADIDGESAGDGSESVSLSSDGNRLAIGASGNDGNGIDSGHARVYQWSGMAWTQLGADIDGEAAGDGFGSRYHCLPTVTAWRLVPLGMMAILVTCVYMNGQIRPGHSSVLTLTVMQPHNIPDSQYRCPLTVTAWRLVLLGVMVMGVIPATLVYTNGRVRTGYNLVLTLTVRQPMTSPDGRYRCPLTVTAWRLVPLRMMVMGAIPATHAYTNGRVWPGHSLVPTLMAKQPMTIPDGRYHCPQTVTAWRLVPPGTRSASGHVRIYQWSGMALDTARYRH